jgi:leader peptidase (prepilin peptidase)/N-methyltransferase
MEYLWLTVIFLFGAAIGSFVCVLSDRYKTGMSFSKGRSICFSCGEKLNVKDLIPIFSFIFLKGRCQHCGSKIPVKVVWTEVIMGILSVLAAFKSDFLLSSFVPFPALDASLIIIINYLLLLIIFACIVLISSYDLRHFIIPDSFLLFLLFFTFLHLFVSSLFHFSFIFPSLFASLVLTLPFFIIFLISKGKWFGFGDIKYILVLGFWLGFASGLSAIVLAFWIGAVISVCLLILKKIVPCINLPLFKNNLTIKSEIPFGPFLSLGILASFYLSLDLFKIHELFNF